ncbi:non-homologous end-joining DNA ligase [Nocardioides pacificus]
MRPMLATRGSHVPTGDDWVHEVKWDGMRVLARLDPDADSDADSGRVVRLTSRNENDVTVSFPELQEPPEGLLGRSALLDGEVVAFADGIPTFAALGDRMHVRNARRAAALATTNPVTFIVFDLLALDGDDLTRRPLAERRELLEGLGVGSATWQVPPWYDDGDMLLRATAAQGLEGVVSKRRSSRYEPGARSKAWLKFPHRRRTSYVVGGWRAETGSDTRLGAVLVGEPTPDGLVFRGRVGSGITGRTGPALLEQLGPLARASSPFADPIPRVDALGTTWVEPVVVVDVEALGLGGQGRLRQPSYRGTRPDLGPEDL